MARAGGAGFGGAGAGGTGAGRLGAAATTGGPGLAAGACPVAVMTAFLNGACHGPGCSHADPARAASTTGAGNGWHLHTSLVDAATGRILGKSDR